MKAGTNVVKGGMNGDTLLCAFSFEEAKILLEAMTAFLLANKRRTKAKKLLAEMEDSFEIF